MGSNRDDDSIKDFRPTLNIDFVIDLENMKYYVIKYRLTRNEVDMSTEIMLMNRL